MLIIRDPNYRNYDINGGAQLREHLCLRSKDPIKYSLEISIKSESIKVALKFLI